MALSDPSIYSPPTDDEEIKKKRRLLASSLWEARQKGLTPEQAFSKEMVAEPSEFAANPNIRLDDLNLSPLEIGGFIDRLYAGKYDKPKSTMSTFAQEEQEARKRSAASGAFGGEGWKGKSSQAFVRTPNLDRLAEMQKEPVGFRTMADSRRSIESPEGEAKRLFRKALDMRIDPSTLITREGGLTGAINALKEAGIGRGILTAEETKARRELSSQQRRTQREQEAAYLKELRKQNPVEGEEEEEED
jgi:hypothetical protein